MNDVENIRNDLFQCLKRWVPEKYLNTWFKELDMTKESKVILNEEEITKDDFEKKKEKLERKPGVKVVKVKENTYKTRIQG